MSIATLNLVTVTKDLHARYDHAIGASELDRLITEIVAQHTANATVTDFLPILVEREVVAHLEKMGVFPARRVVFVDRGNRVMAEVAAAITRAAAGTAVRVATAPVHPEIADDSALVRYAERHGLHLTGETYRASRNVTSADVVVYLDPTDVRDIAAKHELIWKLPSSKGMTREQHETLTGEIADRVRAMLTELEVHDRPAALVV